MHSHNFFQFTSLYRGNFVKLNLSDNTWLSPLANCNFRLLYSAQVTSLFGTGLTTIALALFAYDLAGEQAGQVLGIALALKMLAYVLFAPIAAAFVESVSRIKLLVSLDVVRGAIVFSLPFVSELWQIYSLIFLLSLCSATFTPAFQSIIPEILPDKDQYTRALSLSRLAYDMENILSPSLAALCLLMMSYSDFFIINAVTFLLSAILLVKAQVKPKTGFIKSAPFKERLTQGVKIYFKTPRLRSLLLINIAVAAIMAVQIVNTVVYVRSQLQLSEQALTFVYLALGTGSLCGAILLPKIINKIKLRSLMLSSGVICSLVLMLGSLSPDLFALISMFILLGFGLSLVQTPVGNILKMSSRDEHRNALFAAQFSLSHAGFLICYPLAGWLGSEYGVTNSFWIMACIAMLAMIGAIKLWPAKDSDVLSHMHPAIEHSHWHSHLEQDGHHCDHSHEIDPGPEPHIHEHHHQKRIHKHHFVIDNHHDCWPQ
jgi:MFS family permease